MVPVVRTIPMILQARYQIPFTGKKFLHKNENQISSQVCANLLYSMPKTATGTPEYYCVALAPNYVAICSATPDKLFPDIILCYFSELNLF